MCGRYNILPDVRPWLDALGIALEFDWPPAWNVSPGRIVPVVVARGDGLVAVPMHWGFVPRWQKDPKPRIRPINARGDHVATSGLFRDSWRYRRCLVPAGGFYEWQAAGTARKRPFHIHRADGRPLFMGGIHDACPHVFSAPGDVTETFAIVTTEANATIAPVHDRMPVIVGEDALRAWLASENEARAMLVDGGNDTPLVLDEISTRVNSVANDDESIILPTVRH